MNDVLSAIGSFLKDGNDFLITAHYAPDGDNLGACLGVYHALKQAGKRAVIVNEDRFVERYSFLFAGEEKAFVQYSDQMIEKFDKVIILDTANFERIGKVKNIISENAAMVNIDHHPTNEKFGTLNYIDPSASSASQIVFKVLKDNGFRITKEVSDALLSGVLSDTGGLRFNNTDISTVSVVKELMECGSDLADITDRIFLRTSYEETVKISEIASKIRLFKEEKIALAYNDQEKNPILENEPVLMILNSIEEAEVSLFVRKNGDNFFKISLRSKGGLNVSDFSAKWNGGGHKNAAGIKFKGSYADLEDTVLKELKQACREFYAGK
jgi:bifunctional oligoribonuclease and PAP phosphatase NrnA